jgi:hypothetical protein
MKYGRRCAVQKWEYLIVSSAYDKGDDRAKRVNGQELQDWKSINLYEYINQLGEVGWELVGYSADRFANQHMALKRPKQ